MSEMECIITGCALEEHDAFIVGDLHEMGDTWIFNGVVRGDQAYWIPKSVGSYPQRDKVINLTGIPYFERRGVFVFQRDTSLLNEAAKQHIGVSE